jgi:hypothetical protein
LYASKISLCVSFLDLTKNLVLEDIAYDYNKDNHILAFVGRTPLVNVGLEVAKTIELEKVLIEDQSENNFNSTSNQWWILPLIIASIAIVAILLKK